MEIPGVTAFHPLNHAPCAVYRTKSAGSPTAHEIMSIAIREFCPGGDGLGRHVLVSTRFGRYRLSGFVQGLCGETSPPLSWAIFGLRRGSGR